MNKQYYTYIMECYSTVKGHKLVINAMICEFQKYYVEWGKKATQKEIYIMKF